MRALLKLSEVLRRNEYDLAHVHLFSASLFAALASMLAPNVSWCMTERSVRNRRRSLKLLKLMDALVYSRYPRIIAVSDSVRASLADWLPCLAHKIAVIPNGVPIEETCESDSQVLAHQDSVLDVPASDGKTVLFVGGLRFPKGADILLRAVALLKIDTPFRVWIAGEGPLRPDLEQLSS